MENPGQAAAFCLGQGWQVICDLKGNRTLKGAQRGNSRCASRRFCLMSDDEERKRGQRSQDLMMKDGTKNLTVKGV